MEQDLKTRVEAVLFASGRKHAAEEIARLCRESNIEAVKSVLQEFKKDLEDKQSSLMLIEDSDGWRLTVREKYLQYVKKIVTKTELPKSLLETLAVVAYKAPAKQSDIIKIRHNKGYKHMELLEKDGYITREKKGRTKIIKVTQKFYDYFDLMPGQLKKKFDSVQKLEQQLEDADEKKLEQMKTPMPAEEDPAAEGGGAGELKTYDRIETFQDRAMPVEEYGEKLGNLEVVDEPLEPEGPKAPPALNPLLEPYGEHKKKHKKKKVIPEEEAAEEAIAEETAEEAVPEAPGEGTPEELTEEKKLELEEKKAAEAAAGKAPSYVSKGIFSKGVPKDIAEKIDRRVKEMVTGKPEKKKKEEDYEGEEETEGAPNDEVEEAEEGTETEGSEKE
jgi:segregation and condensation protein B